VIEGTGSVRGDFRVRRTRAGLGRLAALSLTLLLAGCAVHEATAPESYQSNRASRLFAAGFQDVSDIYIEPVSVSDLALAGLENLASIDPEVTVVREDSHLLLTVKGQSAGQLALPSAQDSDGWGDLAADAVNIGRAHSKQLASVAAEDLYEAVFDGVTAQLDGFSRYAGREEARENRASRDGFGGIGVRISLIDEGVKVLSVMEATPAEEAGLLDGDVIVMIDGVSVTGLSQREVVRRLRGPLRSKVTLTIDRPGQTTRQLISVTRAHIVPQTVKYQPEKNKIAYIGLSGFNQSTASTLRRKVEQAQEELGADLTGIVLDLRNNPGGLLDQSVSVADLFMTSGRIVSTHGRHPDSHQYFDANGEDLAQGVPIAVLINGHSASASEIVAAALQDTGRAVVIGSSSFGKGTVQTVLRLPNEGELTLTWARFHAPTGYGLNGRGVLPDVCTSDASSSAETLLEALRGGRLMVDHAVRGKSFNSSDEAGIEAFRAQCPQHEGENQIDLEIAAALLTDPALYARALHGSPNTAIGGSEQAKAPAVVQ